MGARSQPGGAVLSRFGPGLAALALGLAGGFLFYLIGIPLAWKLGALTMAAVVAVLVRDRGMLECQSGPVRVIAWQLGPWLFNHWTPFQELSPEEASSPGYRHALERQHARPDLPYGLEVWRGAKVLSVLWADNGAFEVDSFVRGSWEDEALVL